MSVSVSSLSANLQEHLADNPALFAKFFTMMDNEPHMAVYENVVDKLALYELAVGDPGQPGNRGSYDAKAGVLAWQNRTLEVKNGEVTLTFTQAQIEALHKTHLAKVFNETRRNEVYDMPFESYMLQRVIERLSDQIERTLKWKGALNASGTATADIANGFETKIAADIIATTIPGANVFAGGAITAANAEAQFKGVLDIVAAQNPEYLMQDLVCYASPENIKYYWENYRSNHGALPYNTAFKKRVLDDMDNVEFIPQMGLSGDDRIIITPRKNFAIGTDSISRIDNIEIEKEKRDLHVMIDFKIGFEYGLADLIWTNDQ